MANANISHITFSNTFSDWRGATNDLSNSVNNMRNTDYVRDGGDNLEIKNGRVFIAKTSGTTLDVTANVNIANNLITKTMIINDTASFNGDDARFTNTNVIVDIANTLAVKNLTSNTFIHAQNVITQDLIVGGDDFGECWIQGDPSPSKKPLFVNGVFQNLDRGLNFIPAGIASVFVTANSANTKVIDVFAEVPLLDGERGIKGEKGEVGENGDIGFDGIQGTKGEKGEANVKGDLGDNGDKGLTGENVGGIPGEKGEPGDKGDPGFGQQGDKGDKGEKGDAIGATKGEKGEKGDPGEKGQEGFPNTNGAKGELGEKGDLGLIGDKGDSFDSSTDLVKAFVNFGGGFPGFSGPLLKSFFNVSSVILSGSTTTEVLYRVNFATPLTNEFYSIIGSAIKPSSGETSHFDRGTGHLQSVSKNQNFVTFRFALSGYRIDDTATYIPIDASIIVIRQDGVTSPPPEAISLSGTSGSPNFYFSPNTPIFTNNPPTGYDLTMGFEFKANGILYTYELTNGPPAGLASVQPYITGEWCNVTPTTTYYIRATVVATIGGRTPNYGDSLNTWLALSSDRGWYHQSTTEYGVYGYTDYTLKVEIASDSGGSNILGTGYYTFAWEGGA